MDIPKRHTRTAAISALLLVAIGLSSLAGMVRLPHLAGNVSSNGYCTDIADFDRPGRIDSAIRGLVGATVCGDIHRAQADRPPKSATVGNHGQFDLPCGRCHDIVAFRRAGIPNAVQNLDSTP